MTDKEKFEGFKRRVVEENEAKYGKEIREKYGDDTIDESNRKLMNLSKGNYEEMQKMGDEILTKLQNAVKNEVDYKDEIGKEIALLHKDWLGFTLPNYTPVIHRGLAQMYVMDERFTAYYDKEQVGCAEFLKNAIEYHIK